MTAVWREGSPAPGSGGSEASVEASGLGRRFGRHWALAHVDLRLEAGEALLLAGDNGSGKTTLLRSIAGLLRPTRGRLRIHGEDLSREPRSWRREVGLATHEPCLYAGLTTLETLELWARMLDRPAGGSDLRLLLAEIGLEWAEGRKVEDLSAGMRKRLALARIRLQDCRVRLLDEPFATLDGVGQRLVEGWIEEDLASGRSLILASHAVERCAALCDRAVVLRRGQIVWEGPAEQASRWLAAAQERIWAA